VRTAPIFSLTISQHCFKKQQILLTIVLDVFHTYLSYTHCVLPSSQICPLWLACWCRVRSMAVVVSTSYMNNVASQQWFAWKTEYFSLICQR